MKTRDGYKRDLYLSSMIRIALGLSLLAIAIMLSACGSTGSTGPHSFNLKGKVTADYQPAVQKDDPAVGEVDQTRNQLPLRGADEKSDSTLKKSAK